LIIKKKEKAGGNIPSGLHRRRRRYWQIVTPVTAAMTAATVTPKCRAVSYRAMVTECPSRRNDL